MATLIDKVYSLNIGVQGENIARAIELDMTEWVEAYPDASFHVLFKPYNESEAVPMVSTLENNILTWIPTLSATAVSGVGYTEIRALDPDTGLIRKSRIIPTSVEYSLSGVEQDPPEPYEDWVNSVLAIGAEAFDLRNDRIPFPKYPYSKYGNNGQLLRTIGNGRTKWVDEGLPTDEQTENAVSSWLDLHPEATTSVLDHSLTHSKLVNGTLGFVTPEMFGAVGDGFADDTEAIQNCLDSGFAVFGSQKEYLISETIIITSFKYINFSSSLIKVNFDGTAIDVNTGWRNTGTIDGLNIDCDGHEGIGFKVSGGKRNLYKNIHVENCNGKFFKLQGDTGGSHLVDCWARTDGQMYDNSVALDVSAVDWTVSCFDYSYCVGGVEVNSACCIFDNIHGFIYGPRYVDVFPDSYFMKFNCAGDYIVTNSYSDTQKMHFWINAENVCLKITGTYFYVGTSGNNDTNVMCSVILQQHGPCYAIYAQEKRYLKSVSIRNSVLTCGDISYNTSYIATFFLCNIDDNAIDIDESVTTRLNGSFINQNKYVGIMDKNILTLIGNTNVSDNLTITPDDLGRLHVEGTTDAKKIITIGYINVKKDYKYTVSGSYKGADNKWRLWVESPSAFPLGNRLVSRTGPESATASANAGKVPVQLIISPTSDPVDLWFYPMVIENDNGNQTFSLPHCIIYNESETISIEKMPHKKLALVRLNDCSAENKNPIVSGKVFKTSDYGILPENRVFRFTCVERQTFTSMIVTLKLADGELEFWQASSQNYHGSLLFPYLSI